MKKIFFIFAMLSALVLSSCSESAKAKLEKQVAEEAEGCPLYFDEGVLCTHLFTQGNNVVFVIEVDEYTAEFSVGDLDDPSVRRELKEEMIDDLRYDSDPDIKEIVKLLKDANYNLVYRCVGKYYNEQRDITIYSNEL